MQGRFKAAIEKTKKKTDKIVKCSNSSVFRTMEVYDDLKTLVETIVRNIFTRKI